jgi:hypothetical protein
VRFLVRRFGAIPEDYIYQGFTKFAFINRADPSPVSLRHVMAKMIISRRRLLQKFKSFVYYFKFLGCLFTLVSV